MFIYNMIFIFSLSIFFACIEVISSINKQLKTAILVMLLVGLFIIAGFRGYGVDSDYLSYVMIFNSAPSINDVITGNSISNEEIEFGYTVLNSIVKSFTDDYEMIFCVCALIHIGIYYRILSKSNMAIMSFLVLISIQYTMEMAQLRQGIVCALMLVSGYELSVKKYKKYIFYIIIGMLFHYTAIIGLLLLPLSKIHWTRSKIYIVCVFLIAVLQVDWINGFLNYIAYNISDEYNIRLLKYTASAYEGTERMHFWGDVKLIGLLVMLSLLINYIPEKKRSIFNVMISMFILGCIMRFSFHEFTVFSARMSECFFPSLVVLLPLIFYFPLNKNIKLIGIILFLLLNFYQQMHAEYLLVM